jgi:thiol-disulfide isomerase/thioredoxin
VATPKRPSNRMPLVLIGLGVVGLAVLIAVLTTTGTDAPASLDAIAGDPTIEGATLPPAGDPGADPAVGSPAPVVRGAGFDGEPVTLGEPGQPQLVGFMAAWCPHCQDELPEVAGWIAAGEVPAGLEVVAVATGLDPTRPNWPPDAWFEREGYPGPVLVDDAGGSVGAAYGLTGTPYWVGIDADGRIAIRVAGRLGIDTLDQLAQALAAS